MKKFPKMILMNTQNTNPYKLPAILVKRSEQFKKITDPTKRYERIIEIGKKLQAYPEELKIEANQVKGCASLTYIYGTKENGLMQYSGWSNSHLVLGLLSLLIEACNGESPEAVLAIDIAFMEDIGLAKTLTASRANGFINTFNMMRLIAGRHSGG
jgi:cysteine desulfuration protein SufE